MRRFFTCILLFFVVAVSVASMRASALPEPTIQVTGLVDHPYNITLAELEAMPTFTERATCRCVGWPPDNPGVNGYDVYTYDWTGVRLSDLLQRAGVKPNGVYVIVYASDGYTSGLQLKYAMDENMMVAVKADGASLDKSTGAPFRLVVPGWWGYKWVKFVERIEVVDYIYEGTWESSGYADVAIIITPTVTESGIDQYALPVGVVGVALVAVGVYMVGVRRSPSP